MLNSYIWPKDRILSTATTSMPSLPGPLDSIEDAFHIPQSASITRALLSDGLMSYQGYFVRGSYISHRLFNVKTVLVKIIVLILFKKWFKRSFFQAAVVSILLYGCTTWTLTKRLERRLDGNYTRMLRAVLNKSWRQHPTRLQLYGRLPPITKTIQVRRTRHAGHCWRSKDELISDVLLWTPTYGCARVGRPARTYIQQLCEDTGCNPEDLPEAMNDREKWRERVRDIRAGGATWWWWWLIKKWTSWRDWSSNSFTSRLQSKNCNHCAKGLSVAFGRLFFKIIYFIQSTGSLA